MNIHELDTREFKGLPLVVEGESKEVRYAGDGLAVIKLKPTIYSYTHNRAGVIPGSESVRLQAIQKLLPCLGALGLQHAYREVNDNWILSELVLQPEVKGAPAPFRPDDVDVTKLPVAPPIEVIAKKRHTGTSKHRYFNLPNTPTRDGQYIGVEDPYPEPFIRFDWRNPMRHPQTGERLADEILPEPMADWYIDTEKARKTASLAFKGLSDYMSERGLDLWDICFFISQEGDKLFGEISPDCMRVRCEEGSLDKDVWRAGGSSEDVLLKWKMMTDML